MIVLNKGTSIFSQGLHVFEKDKDGKAVAVAHKMKSVRFMLGANEVSDDDWEQCKKYEIVQHLLGKGDLVEQDSRPISKRPEKLAIALVRGTYDADLLARWHEDDKRPAVQKAISDQIKECTLSDEDRAALKGEKDDEA